jgi:hypothetical protein
MFVFMLVFILIFMLVVLFMLVFMFIMISLHVIYVSNVIFVSIDNMNKYTGFGKSRLFIIYCYFMFICVSNGNYSSIYINMLVMLVYYTGIRKSMLFIYLFIMFIFVLVFMLVMLFLLVLII